MKNKHFALKLSIPFALIYWVIESLIHFFVFDEHDQTFEWIPSDSNELWMRCVIFILLVLFGFIVDHYKNNIFRKNCEKNDVYISMLSATHHILNNLLNNMLLFRMEAEDSKDFNKDLLKDFDRIIEKATQQIHNLEGIDEPDKKAIENRYKPKNN